MLIVLLVLQIIVTVAMIVVILIQRSASDGMAGLAGGGNSLMSGRASANLLTRITSALATIFIVNSLVMATMTSRSSKSDLSAVDKMTIEKKSPAAPIADAPSETSSDNSNTSTPAKAKPDQKSAPAKAKPDQKSAPTKAKPDQKSAPAVPIAE
jgi:preprotein translocase subunit SecG